MCAISFALFVVALVPLVHHVRGEGGYITVKNCTDRAFCFSGCNTYTLPTEQCLPTADGSQLITCPPAITVCGDLAYFTDSACENLLLMDAFLCDQCNQNNNGQFTSAICSREGDFEFLGLASCTSQCGSCSVGANMTRDTCIPFGQQHVDIAVQRNPLLKSLLPPHYQWCGGAAVREVPRGSHLQRYPCGEVADRKRHVRIHRDSIAPSSRECLCGGACRDMRFLMFYFLKCTSS
jgi:hypothetical protein